jgi:histidine ammonia-lyase
MTWVLRSRDDFTLEALEAVAWRGEAVAFDAEALGHMAACRAAFERLLDDPAVVIYGVTSGYGQQAKLRFSPAERRAHAARPPLPTASSFGDPLPERVARAIVFARLANFVEGHAAVTPALAEAVAAMLDGGELPPVPALGNGCPGEIQALGHLFGDLAQSHPLAEKDALALVNGSPCATALIGDAVLVARRRLRLATEVFALSWEALGAPLGHLDPALEALWGDPHEATALQSLRALIDGGEGAGRRPYQAPVSWRILPRLLGQAARALAQAETVAATALRAVSDNPVFLAPDQAHPNGRVISTGGYHNAAVPPALDALAGAWADLALLCERQANKLLDGEISLLPDQLQAAPGAYLGCLPFTAAALPGSESGGFGQNDVAVPSFTAWRQEAEAGRCLDAGLAVLAVVASQAFHVTGRAAPPALAGPLEDIRAVAPPITEVMAPGPPAERLWQRFTGRVFAA